MNLDTFRELLGVRGQAALRAAESLSPTEADYLRVFTRLSKQFPAELARAAIETVLLRIKARSRHSRADRFHFTRETLEQSTSEPVARHRANRFARFGTVLDLCCGVGMDAIALAEAGCAVHAVELDPLKAAMAAANAAAAGVSIHVHAVDATTMALPNADAAFADPSRRTGERRHLDPEQYEPRLSAILARFPTGFPLGVKIAPGVARRDFESLNAEAEFITSDGELKECVLWFGGLKTCSRRASVLSEPGSAAVSAASLTDEATNGEGPGSFPLSVDEFDARPRRPRTQDGEFLFDPDSAVIRADLLDLLAEQLDAHTLEPGIALLTGSTWHRSPFAAAFRIEAVLPLKPDAVRNHLKPLGIGRVTILKRAIDIDVNAFQKKLKLDGLGHRHLIVTMAGGKPAAIVATIQE